MFLLLEVSVVLLLNGRLIWIFGLTLTFNLAGLLMLVEIVDESCQKFHTSNLVSRDVNLWPLLFLPDSNNFYLVFSLSVSLRFFIVFAKASTFRSSSRLEINIVSDKSFDRR